MRGLTIDQLWSFLAVALPALAALLVPMPSVDLAYQLRAGAAMLAGGGIPTVEQWTFTAQGTPWLDQQWAAQALLAGVFQAGGWTGLALLRAALVGATFGLVQAAIARQGLASRAAAMATLAGFAVAAPALALRPQLLAVVLFAATLLGLAARHRHPRATWLIPLIAMAWANLHGTFPLVLVLVGLAVIDDVARTGTWRRSTGLVVIGVVSAIATLANPFGVGASRYVVTLATNPAVAEQVSEWRPPSLVEPVGALFYGSLGVAVLLAAVRFRARPFSRADVGPSLTLLAFGALGAFTGRGLAWWALAASVALATLFRPAAEPVKAAARLRAVNTIVAVLLVVAGVALLPAWRSIGPAGVPATTLTFAPQGIAAQLDALPLEQRVWNPQSWGSWLELAAPGQRYATDSRIELFPAEVWRDAEAVERGAGATLDVLDRYEVSHVVARADQAVLISLMDGSRSWTRLYADADGVIWVTAGR